MKNPSVQPIPRPRIASRPSASWQAHHVPQSRCAKNSFSGLTMQGNSALRLVSSTRFGLKYTIIDTLSGWTAKPHDNRLTSEW